MKAYFNYFKLRLITNLQYRAAALAGISTQLFFGMVFLMVYIALYESNTNVEVPMNLKSVITYLWLGQAFFAIIYPYIKDAELLSMIRNGNLAYELVRPQNFYFKYYIKMVCERLAAVILRCSPVLIVAFLLPEPYNLTLPVSFEAFILFILSMIFSCLLITSMSLLMHIITMFTLNADGVIGMYCMAAEVFTGLLVPVPFLPSFMIKIGKYLPFRFIGDFSYRVYSGDISTSEGRIMIIGSILWTVLTIGIGYLLTKLALKKAVIQGG